MECLNCGNTFEGKYCNMCGQKAVTHRLTIREYFHKFIHTFTHIDRGIFYLAIELFKRPGEVASEYISGKRAKYFSPLQYMILMVAIGTFITLNYNILGPKLDPALLQSADPQVRYRAGMNIFFYKYFNVVLFFSVPVVALFSWLFFKKSDYNFAENLVFITFISAQRTLVFILLTPVFYFTRDVWYAGVGIYYLFWVVYFVIAYRQFYWEGWAKVIFKFIGVFLISIAVTQSAAFLIVKFIILKDY